MENLSELIRLETEKAKEQIKKIIEEYNKTTGLKITSVDCSYIDARTICNPRGFYIGYLEFKIDN